MEFVRPQAALLARRLREARRFIEAVTGPRRMPTILLHALTFGSGKAAISCLLLSMIVVGCTTVHSRMMKSADTLGSSASKFAGHAGRDFPRAIEFAGETQSFVAVVDHGGDREVISAYEHLWNEFHALREEIGRSNDPVAQVDFEPVSQAFANVVRGVSGYSDADGSIYARGGFPHDPYYDLPHRE